MAGDGLAGATGGDTDEFASRLQTLKANGSAVLVVGRGGSDAHVDFCRQFLGAETAAPRHRLLVFTNGTFALDERVPGGPGTDDTRVITASPTRSTAVTAAQAPGCDVADLSDASLGELGVAIVEEVEVVQQRYGPLEPAELRIGVDSLAPLLDAYGERAVFSFLILATSFVRQCDALGHVHLPVARTAYTVRLLEPLFDAVVELRLRDGQPEQRWYLDGDSLTSRWVSL